MQIEANFWEALDVRRLLELQKLDGRQIEWTDTGGLIRRTFDITGDPADVRDAGDHIKRWLAEERTSA